jgi:transcriptional regulator with XRE-family HTH domain
MQRVKFKAMKTSLGRQTRLIGTYIRQKREILGLSQRELGQRLTPPVTTQFISNMERGVTPLPAVHIHAIAQALGVPENEITQIMEKEFLLRITEKTRTSAGPSEPIPSQVNSEEHKALLVRESYHEFFVRLDETLPQATLSQLDALAQLCESQFRIPARVLLRSLFERKS